MTDESKIVEAFESQFHEKPTRRKDGQYLRDYWRALFNQFRSGYVAGVGARPESEAERVLREWGSSLVKLTKARKPKHPDWTKVHQLQGFADAWASEAELLARKLTGETTTKGE